MKMLKILLYYNKDKKNIIYNYYKFIMCILYIFNKLIYNILNIYKYKYL